MNILITGANGLLGQKLLKLLSDKPEIRLIATSLGESRLPMSEHNYAYESMNITDENRVMEVITRHQPDSIIHTAAMTHVDECHENRKDCWLNNVTATKYLIKAAESIGSHFIHVSTDFVFDGKDGPYSEGAEPNPVNYYGESKFKSEKIVMESLTKWAIVRTVLVYGVAHQMKRTNIILWVKNSLEQGKKIKMVNDQWRTPTLAEDLAKGCYLMATQKAEGVFNISGKDMLTPYEMGVQTADLFDLDKSLIEKANSLTFRQAAIRPPRTGLFIDKAKKELGYKPRSFNEGLAILAAQIE